MAFYPRKKKKVKKRLDFVEGLFEIDISLVQKDIPGKIKPNFF